MFSEETKSFDISDRVQDPPEALNVLSTIRLLDIFVASQRKLVGERVTPLLATNFTGREASTLGTTGAVLEFPADPDHLDCLIITGLNTGNTIYRIPIKGSISGEAFRTNQTVVINSVMTASASLGIEICRTFGINSVMAMPIRYKGECLAVLSVYSPVEEAFPAEVVQSIKIVASLIGAILGSPTEVYEGPTRAEDIADVTDIDCPPDI